MTNDNGGLERSLCIDSPSKEDLSESGWSAYRGSYGKLGFPPVDPYSWSFVAAVYNEETSEAQLYVDGQIFRGKTDMGSGGGSLLIGSNGTTGTGFIGYIDNVFVYKEALSKDALDFLRMSVPVSLYPVAGSAGYALQLSGSHQHMEVLDSAAIWRDPNQFSVAWWMSPERSPSAGSEELSILYKGSEAMEDISFSLVQDHGQQVSKLRLQMHGGRNYEMGYDGLDWSVAMKKYALRNWVHLAVAWNGTFISVFEDGEYLLGTPWQHNNTSRLDLASRLLVGASRVPELFGNHFMGAIDEVQIWHIALGGEYLSEIYCRKLVGSEAGLAAYWTFDEGRGAVAISSASILENFFGFLTSSPETYSEISDTWFWAPSHAPIADRLEAAQYQPLLLSLNGSDAKLQSLQAVLTSLPAKGSLYASSGSNISTADLFAFVANGKVLSIGDKFPVGVPALIYYYDGIEPEPDHIYVNFTFKVLSGSGEESLNEGLVSIRVQVQKQSPSMLFSDPTFHLFDMHVEDIDAAEGDGVLRVDVSVDQDLSKNSSHSGDGSFLSLGEIQQLDFDEGSGQHERRFSFRSDMESINAALSDISLFTPGRSSGATIRVHVDDMGPPGAGGAMTAEETIKLQYTFGTVPYITEIIPATAPTSGGQYLTVYGKNFGSNTNLYCVFGTSFYFNATRISPSMLRCPIPSHGAGVIAWTLRNDLGYSSNKLQFTYAPPLVLTSLRPDLGYVEGGSRISVYGEGFLPYASHYCMFGSVVVAGDYVSSNLIKCTSPKQPQPGDVQVSISSNGLHYSTSFLKFSYVHSPFVGWIHPSFGSSGGGSKIVTVYGSNFFNYSTLACRLGDVVVSGIFVSANQVLCNAPPRSNGSDTEAALSISTNGIDFSSSMALYRYIPEARITGMLPPVGSVLGNYRIKILGENFYDGKSLFCHFRGELLGAEPVLVEAEYVSSNLITCVVPPSVKGVGNLVVEMTNNGAEFTSSGYEFHYVDPPVAFSISPSSGLSFGGTRVSILGSGFLAGSSYCRFELEEDVSVVIADVIHSSYVECTTPEFVLSSASNAMVYVVLSPDDIPGEEPLPFLYYLPPFVDSIFPKRGPACGGTEVTISGAGFFDLSTDPSSSWFCHFGSLVVPASYISSTVILCTSPMLFPTSGDCQGPSEVKVNISFNLVDISSSGITFVFDPLPQLSMVSPLRGSTEGGTLLNITGSNFVNSSHLSCFVNGSAVLATYISDTAIACLTPPSNASGPQSLALSTNMQDLNTVLGQFTYIPPSVVSSISPSQGQPNVSVSVTLQGSDFFHSNEIACLVSQNDSYGKRQVIAKVVARWISSSKVMCVLPALELLDGSQVDVWVSNNGVDLDISSWAPFYIRSTVYLEGMVPEEVPMGGGSSLIITGSFQVSDDTNLSCMIDGFVAGAALRINDSAISCRSPAVLEEGPKELRIVGEDSALLSNTTLITYYYKQPELFSIWPQTFSSFSGGASMVYLQGHGFRNFSTILCKFDEVQTVEGVYLRDSLISCPVPPLPDSEVRKRADFQSSIDVSLNGQDFTSFKIPFLYLRNLSVMSSSPVAGPSSGGTPLKINVGTEGQYRHQDLSCFFQDVNVLVPLLWSSISSLGTCVTPPYPSAGLADIKLVMPAADNTSFNPIEGGSVMFQYYVPPKIDSIWPLFGSERGGTLVKISGSGFLNSPYLFCRFGDVVVAPVDAPDEHTILCLSPKSTFGVSSVSVEVTNNMLEYTTDGLTFEYVEEMSITAISPTTGPLVGNTIIWIDGKNFYDSPDLACRFDSNSSLRVPAIFVSTTRVTCVSAPRTTRGQVTVETTSNGVDFTRQGLQFFYSEVPYIMEISPVLGPEGGSTDVIVVGQNFWFRESLVCEFGSAQYRVPARWLSTTMLVCKSPPHRPMDVALRVSNNGQQFFGAAGNDSAILYQYHVRSSIVRVAPAAGVLEGGSVVVVSGTGFMNTSSLSCRFGDSRALSAIYVSPEQVQCKSPRSSLPGEVIVEVSNNGKDFTTDGVTIFLNPKVVMTAIRPHNGPSNGGTNLEIMGSGFQTKDIASCRFGAIEIEARVVSDSVIICNTPAHIPGSVVVVAVLNGIDYSGPGLSFNFYGE